MSLESLPFNSTRRKGPGSRLVTCVAGLVVLSLPLARPSLSRAESAGEDAGSWQLGGSFTTRTTLSEGSENDRWSSDLSLEWLKGRWSGGLSARLDGSRIDGGIHHEPGVGSFDLPERWIGFGHRGPKNAVDLRLGTSFGLRFAESLVMGSASFEGIAATVELGQRVRVVSLLGRTDAVDPLELFDEPITLLAEEPEFLGTDGELAGLRTEIQANEQLRIGMNLVRAESRAQASSSTTVQPDSADLGSIDVAYQRGPVDFALEAAFRKSGGRALFLRTDFSPSDRWALALEHRNYSSFVSPLGNAPLYSGLSGGGDEDERGLLLRLDLNPADRLHLAVSFDYTRDPAKTAACIKRDKRFELDYALSKNTALAYGFEFENQSGPEGDKHDGAMHSLLVTHSLERGGRLSGRFAVDRSSGDGHVSTARFNYRQPFKDRRYTLLVDDSLRFEKGSITNSLQVGGSVRLAPASHLSIRGSLGSGETKSLSLTFYQRF